MAVRMVNFETSEESGHLGVPTAERLCDRNCEYRVSAQIVVCFNEQNVQVLFVLNLVLLQQQPGRLGTPPAAKATGTALRPKDKQPCCRWCVIEISASKM